MHPTWLILIQYLWETIQILLQFICSYPIKIFFFWISNKTKAVTAHHYGIFYILYFILFYLFKFKICILLD